MITERMKAVRLLMKERGIDAYIVPTADFHESEYVGEYFKCRAFLTGFTGSAGTAVITQTDAGLWTDGRYFVQAEKELAGSGITLFKMGYSDTPAIENYLLEQIPTAGTLGFDGRVVNALSGKTLRKTLLKKGIKVNNSIDLVGDIWDNRPPLSAKKVWLLEPRYAGVSAADKIEKLRQAMQKEEASTHILTTLDDIMWLLNIRGNDIPCNPVALSFLAVDSEQVYLFIQEPALTEPVKEYFVVLGVQVMPYEGIYEWAGNLQNAMILLEESRINDCLYHRLNGSNQLIKRVNPTVLMKAVKNQVEIENLKKTHLQDGIAVTKFIFWLKQQVGKNSITELSAVEQLEQFRRQQEGYLEPSFDTISAYKEHAAVVHYSASKETDKELQAEGLYLVDSGGQYYGGTTDVTRTIALGVLSEDETTHMTLAVISMLRLGNARFLSGCSGVSLDYIAREPFWSRGLNYDHGTGHGVGYLLNVHERPNGIRYRVVPERMDSETLEPGMVTSDEPGIYIAGSHGVRMENLILCKESIKTDFGQFLEFEFLTCIPIDLDGLNIDLMEKKDREFLNQYHQDVYLKLSPYLTDEERKWLHNYTRPI